MAPTKLDICNMALGFIGTRTIQGSELTSSPPNSPEAVQCLLYWDRARRAVLTDFVCEFSVRRSALSTSSATSATASNWAGKYAYPSNALKILSVHSGTDDEREPFEVDYVSDTQCVILTDATSPQCVYVVDVEDLTQWNETFVNAMALKLAILISTALLKNNPEKIKELASLYQAAMPRGLWGEGGWAVNETNTKLGVMNMALGLVGVRMVTSVTENVPEAVQCNLYWDRARRSVLRDFPYRFAVRRSALTPIGSFPSVYDGEWTNCYTAPADMLKVLSIGTATDKQTRQAFSVEHLASGPAIFCNVANAQCTYTADVTDPSKWDEKFTAAMAAKLALYICGPLLAGEKDQGLNKAKELGELYKASIPQDQSWEEGGWASSGDSERLNISNMALGYVGANMISSLTENVPEAVQCNLHWDRARRKVLRDYPYRFSIHRDVLTVGTMPEAYGGDWEKAYAWPLDALRVLSVHDPEDREARQPFAIEYTGSGPLILCNVTDAEVTYIADVEDTALWDEKFIDAMARRLAIEIATALLPAEKMQGKMQELHNLYQMALPGPPMVEENWAVEQNSTRLNICNMALGYVEARTISSITENIPEAIQCSLHWDNARRSTLRDFPYRFAQQRFQLEEVALPALYQRKSLFGAGTFWDLVYGGSLIKAGGGGLQWSHCYKVPECLKIVRVHDGRDRVHRIPFAIELVDGAPCIFTNVARAQATCTIDIEDVGQWDELFVQAMARKLAILIYPALRKERGNGTPRS